MLYFLLHALKKSLHSFLYISHNIHQRFLPAIESTQPS